MGSDNSNNSNNSATIKNSRALTGSWQYSLLGTGLLLLITLCLLQLRRMRRRSYNENSGKLVSSHRWQVIDHFLTPTYCVVSGERVLQGGRCELCGLCVCDSNLQSANCLINCKPVSIANNQPILHHWVEGNLPQLSVCYKCSGLCSQEAKLCDFRCAWCQLCVHTDCVQFNEVCNLGQHASAIVPPNCIVTNSKQPQLVQSVQQPERPSNWQPVLVIGNCLSGGGDAEDVLRKFRSVLNAAQVIDLAELKPIVALRAWCKQFNGLNNGCTLRIIVCGGDGTVGWVLSSLEQLPIQPKPAVGIVPIGTGNDLARVLGWGPGSDADDVLAGCVLNAINNASVVQLDRWDIAIAPTLRPLKMISKRRQLTMNNYFSIGVDALVTLNFHDQRRNNPALTGSRLLNKLWYFTYGTKDVWERACHNLHKSISVTLDGRRLNLPELEGLVVLNIGSWGGGCQPWGRPSQMLPPSISDARFELMGLHSSFHIAQLQIGIRPPIRLGQGSHLVITINRGVGKVPVQSDGEPWLQGPGCITVQHGGCATVLRASNWPTDDFD